MMKTFSFWFVLNQRIVISITLLYPPLYPNFMSTCRNGQICYFKKSKKTFWRTLVQGGGEVNLKAYRLVQGEGGSKKWQI